MSTLLFANDAESSLAAPITSSATSLTLVAGGGGEFPNPAAGQVFTLTAIDAATGLLKEIMQCTARAADVLTVVRGQEGTTPLSWLAGDSIQQLWTAGQAAAMEQMTSPVTLTSTAYPFTDTNPHPFIAANPLRRSLALQNLGPGNLTIGPGATIAAGEGISLSGGSPITPIFPVSTQEFSGVADADTTLIIWEGE